MIKIHHDANDLQMFFFQEDINRWIEETELIQQEIIFYNGLFISHLILQKDTDLSETKVLNTHLLEFEQKHQAIRKELKHFSYTSEGIKECEDLQCETHYLNHTAEFKAKIEGHLAAFRFMKKDILAHLNTNLQKHLN